MSWLKALDDIIERYWGKRWRQKQEKKRELEEAVRRSALSDRRILKYMLKNQKQRVFFGLPRWLLSPELASGVKKKEIWIIKKGEEKEKIKYTEPYFIDSEGGSIEWDPQREGWHIKVHDEAWEHLMRRRKDILKSWEEDEASLPEKIPVQVEADGDKNGIAVRVNLPDEVEQKIFEELFLKHENREEETGG